MTTRLERLKEGLVCLVPKDGKAGITCHKKTICDCTAIQLIELVEEAEPFIQALNIIPPTKECGDMTDQWLSKLAKFQGGK